MRRVDESGNTYDRLTVISMAGRSNDGQVVWLCQCSCGKTTAVRGRDLRQGHTRSCGCLARELTSKRSAELLRRKSGSDSYAWKGGRTIGCGGYIKVYKPDHPRADSKGYIFEHILVAERLLGEYIPEGYVVHHLNGIRNDNREENLWIFPSQSAHMAHHQTLRNIL
jgi:hypothetical protein